MDKNEVNKLIKKTKRKSTFLSVIVVIAASAFIFAMESPVKYFLCVLTLIMGIALVIRIQNVSYILYNQCNPQLYYAVTQGLLKQVPLDRQVIVSEFIGDYSSAIKISNSMLQDSKNDLAKLSHIMDITRNAFFAGDYELCQKCIADFNQLSKDKKISKFAVKRNDFYLAYINGNFQQAKEILDEINNIVKKQKNSFRCNMLFYNAITDYSMKNFDLAKSEFQTIIDRFPHMYLANTSREYINSICNNIPVEIIQPVETEIPQSATLPKVSKKDILKLVIAGIVILGCIIGVPTVLNMGSMSNTPNLAIEKYDDVKVSSIEYTLEIDDNHIVCIYKNIDNFLGVAYLQLKENKYECKVANCDDYLLISDDKYTYPSRMHSSGVSCEIVYEWLYDESKAPDSYDIIPIKQDDKTIYFCYKINSPSRYLTDFYGLDLNE